MAKKLLKSGDIYQIPLPNDLGFAYAKSIDLLEIDPDASYPVLIRVYNIRTQDSMVSLDEILNKDLVLSPLLIAGIKPTLSKGLWKVIGNIPPSDGEKLVPNYKKSDPESFPQILYDPTSKWYYLVEADVSKKHLSKYENVKHLEDAGATGSELVSTKIAMALLQAEGKTIEDYFDLDVYYERQYYYQVTHIQPYYLQPPEIRGRAIGS